MNKIFIYPLLDWDINAWFNKNSLNNVITLIETHALKILTQLQPDSKNALLFRNHGHIIYIFISVYLCTSQDINSEFFLHA